MDHHLVFQYLLIFYGKCDHTHRRREGHIRAALPRAQREPHVREQILGDDRVRFPHRLDSVRWHRLRHKRKDEAPRAGGQDIRGQHPPKCELGGRGAIDKDVLCRRVDKKHIDGRDKGDTDKKTRDMS